MMPPDLNSLPASRSSSNAGSPLQLRTRRPSSNLGPSSDVLQHAQAPASPHSPVLSSLQATAAINASRQRSPSTNRSSVNQERRRSGLPDLDPSIHAPGETQRQSYSHESAVSDTGSPLSTADPHHQRAPSLGQLHQQLENEQEAQVNRLLQMIREQQEQINALQPQSSTAAVASEPRTSIPGETEPSAPHTEAASPPAISSSANHTAHAHPRSPLQRPTNLSRQSSRSMQAAAGHGSTASSPSLRPLSAGYGQNEDWLAGGTRDESAFYQAETQTLTRENQMLKNRIRELERQIGEMNAG